MEEKRSEDELIYLYIFLKSQGVIGIESTPSCDDQPENFSFVGPLRSTSSSLHCWYSPRRKRALGRGMPMTPVEVVKLMLATGSRQPLSTPRRIFSDEESRRVRNLPANLIVLFCCLLDRRGRGRRIHWEGCDCWRLRSAARNTKRRPSPSFKTHSQAQVNSSSITLDL